MTILLCTSHRPSPRTRTLCNDLVSASSDFSYLKRGKSCMALVSAYAAGIGAGRVWLISSRYGDPSLIECYEPGGGVIVSILIGRVILMRELGGFTASRRARRLELIPPEDRSLQAVYGAFRLAVGPPGGVARECGHTGRDAGVAELRFEPSKNCLAEVSFMERASGAPCGPRIMVKGFR